MVDLTKKTYFTYAMKMYNNPSCTGLEEFHEDLVRFKYVKRLLHRYVRTGEVVPRLLVNHIIALTNVFRAEAVSRILFYRVHPNAWRALKTVLEYLSLMPNEIPSVDGAAILNTDISQDIVLLRILRESIEGHAKTR
jgi:hypothetical protein